MTPKRILIVTSAWPPRNAIGAHRPYSWARLFVSVGIDVTVVTTRKYAFDAPLDSELEAIPGVRVIEVDYLQGAGAGRVVPMNSDRLARLKRLFRTTINAIGFNAHPRRLWRSAAVAVLNKLGLRFDVVISSYDPEECHLIAYDLKRKGIADAWIADYRDMWSLNHAVGYGAFAKRIVRKREMRSVGSSADLLTTVSPELAADLTKFLSKPAYVIYNGYDAPHPEALDTPPKASSRRPIRIVHTGRVYEGLRDPFPLFKAIIELIREGCASPQSISIDFYGPATVISDYIRATPLIGEFVNVRGTVSQLASLTAQRDADFLLLLESPLPDARGVMTGKIFEYMAARKPVISLGSLQGSAICRLINETGIGRCFGQDVEQLKTFVLDLLRGVPCSFYAPNDAINNYTRKNQAERMLHLIDSISNA